MFEKNLKYYRLKKGLKKKELAQAIGVTPMAVTLYEQGKRRPDMDRIYKICEVLDINMVDLMQGRKKGLKFTFNW